LRRCRFHQFRSHGNGNRSYGTELRQQYNGTAKRQNGNGRTATEGWKPGIREALDRRCVRLNMYLVAYISLERDDLNETLQMRRMSGNTDPAEFSVKLLQWF